MGLRPRCGGEVERRGGVDPNEVGAEGAVVAVIGIEPVIRVLKTELGCEVARVAEVIHQHHSASSIDEILDGHDLRGGVAVALRELDHVVIPGEPGEGDGVSLDSGNNEDGLFWVVDVAQQEWAGD